jgi:hypothetical protein
MTNEHTSSSEADRAEEGVGDEMIEIVKSGRKGVSKGEQGSGEDFVPATVRGESVSATIVRERR